MTILNDDEFRPNYEIRPVDPTPFPNDEQEIFVYGHTQGSVDFVVSNDLPAVINVEFMQRPKEDSPKILADLYFQPEDLERLGVLLQYEAKKYMQLRDELVAAKVASEEKQNKQQQHLSNKGRGL